MDDVSRAYDQWAPSYDSDRNATRDLDAFALRSSGLSLRDANVVEFGCGTGKNSEWIAEHARSLTAMDFSPAMLRRARERVRGDHVRFVQHDVRTTWPVESATVDVVVGNLVLEHVEQLRPVFAEAARVLRVGGALYVAELHPYKQWRGSQAHFTDGASGEVVHVPAFVHAVSDYITDALAVGFTLTRICELTEGGAEPDAPPRLLTLVFQRTGVVAAYGAAG